MNGFPIAKKSLGQHWLDHEESLDAVCAAAKLISDDTVLEIGPGTGTLTRRLVAQAGRVIAVERDDILAATLDANINAPNLQTIHQDILTFDLTSLPLHYKVVANIPYYLTSHLLRLLSETPNPASLAVLLVQKEVAERVAAAPGSMSLVSVTTQYYWQVSLGPLIPAKFFVPSPKVDSQILIMERRAKPLFKDVDDKLFFRLVRAGFSNRRKMLLNSLAGGLQRSKQGLLDDLIATGINPKSRPQELSLRDWHRLYGKLSDSL